MPKPRKTIGDLPYIGTPAADALEVAGYTTLRQIAALTETELLRIHGVGPKAIRLLREALAKQGLSLRP